MKTCENSLRKNHNGNLTISFNVSDNGHRREPCDDETESDATSESGTFLLEYVEF